MAKQRLNLANMALAELAELRDKVERALEKKVTVARADLQERMEALTAIVGPDGVKPARAPRRARKAAGRRGAKAHPMKGRKVAPKYRGPGGELWTGRGRAPRWLADLEKKGKKRDQFLIAKS